ncbi:hypothetical protein LOTGIDRAFT_174751 [Lottia gigantea]|uniref:Uncharacterized protein n=1 Tax=Lottia gigantea TaxID=225164 RepID=V3ZYR0_LOTGI|nr:hypothetical protein LOTGIDRAFT_174751 [Lottia gigantea]ESO96673.1 hypothetical protein LOTGIDRAFT_174751 [Lottia gigantea]
MSGALHEMLGVPVQFEVPQIGEMQQPYHVALGGGLSTALGLLLSQPHSRQHAWSAKDCPKPHCVPDPIPAAQKPKPAVGKTSSQTYADKVRGGNTSLSEIAIESPKEFHTKPDPKPKSNLIESLGIGDRTEALMAEIQQIRNEYEEQNIAEPERATSTPVRDIDIELPPGWDELNIDDYDRSREEIDLRTAAESLQRSINRASETLNQSTNTTFKTPAKTSTKRPITSPFEDNQEKKNRIEDPRKTNQRSISRDRTVGSRDSRVSRCVAGKVQKDRQRSSSHNRK